MVFQDAEIGAQLRTLVENAIIALKMRNTMEYRLALEEIRKYSFSTSSKEKSPEEELARSNLDALAEPIDHLEKELRESRSALILELLKKLAESGLRVEDGDATQLFSGLVGRFEFSEYEMRQLPLAYYALVELAHHPNLAERQRNEILWRIQAQFEYLRENSRHVLVPVILDMYQIALGPVDAIPIPSGDIRHGMAAIVAIVSKHGRSIFQSATPDQLKVLAGYEYGIRKHIVEIAGLSSVDEITDGKELIVADASDSTIQILRNLSNVLEELVSIREKYEQYLHIEAVKVSPHIYYPWLLDQFNPFWQKMHWEVGPGNLPSRDISELFRVLKDHVQHKLVYKRTEEYTEAFDAISEGHIDTLLLEGYQRMVVPHDIKDNGTVWREGLSFMHLAVAYMPPTLLARIVAKYPDTAFANYLASEHARWNKEDDIQ